MLLSGSGVAVGWRRAFLCSGLCALLVASRTKEEESLYRLRDATGAGRRNPALPFPILWWALAAAPWGGGGLRGTGAPLGQGVQEPQHLTIYFHPANKYAIN